MAKVLLPELAEGVESAVVTFWHRAKGDHINGGEDLVEMATEKATFNVPAPASGRLGNIFFQEGETVKVGEALAEIEED